LEDIIAIKISDKKRGKAAFLTWGRVFDPTDPEPLKVAVACAAAKRFGFHDIISIEICESLQDAAGHKYFFEALFALGYKSMPFGRRSHKFWAAKMRRAIRSGKELHLLGPQQFGQRSSLEKGRNK